MRETPLDLCPIFIKKGSLIPNYQEMEYIDSRNIDELVLDIYPGNLTYHHYQDDGGELCLKEGNIIYEFKVSVEEELLIEVNKPVNNYREI